MKTYLVGGYVRDKLRGANLANLDRDYVVVGATPEELKEKGYIQVGESFPVFLHPESKEEYALARKEVKTSSGYHGFKFEFNPDITLEEDLIRRDFTVNAIAMDKSGDLIDPYGGQVDIKNKTLRHVSPHFSEDPLRLVRAARFKAILGFNIAPKTKDLLLDIVKSGELEYISKERILLEVEKTLKRGNIQCFVDTLKELKAWQVLFVGDKFLNYVDGKASFEDKVVLFFYGLDRKNIKRFPLSNRIKREINKLDVFKELLSENDWLKILTKLNAWKPNLSDFKNSITLINMVFDNEYSWLISLRDYVLSNLDKKGLEEYKGASYGSELNDRREILIKNFLIENGKLK